MDFTTRFGRLVDGVLEIVPSYKVVDSAMSPVRVLKTIVELDGYKVVAYLDVPTCNVYEAVLEKYEELEDVIWVSYDIVRKSDDEVARINEEFWAENYFQIPNTPYFVPYKSEAYGKTFDLLKDDLSVLLMGAAANQLTHLEVYSAPDMLATFDTAYIESLMVSVADPAMLTQILYTLSAMLYEKRTVPTLIP